MHHPINHAAATSACAIAIGFNEQFQIQSYPEGVVELYGYFAHLGDLSDAIFNELFDPSTGIAGVWAYEVDEPFGAWIATQYSESGELPTEKACEEKLRELGKDILIESSRSEPSMAYETYTCSLANGLLEYGYTFKAKHGTEDSLFDLVLGTMHVDRPEEVNAALEEKWASHAWAATAIVAIPKVRAYNDELNAREKVPDCDDYHNVLEILGLTSGRAVN